MNGSRRGTGGLLKRPRFRHHKAIGDWTTEEREEVCETDEHAVVSRGFCFGEVMAIDQAEV